MHVATANGFFYQTRNAYTINCVVFITILHSSSEWLMENVKSMKLKLNCTLNTGNNNKNNKICNFVNKMHGFVIYYVICAHVRDGICVNYEYHCVHRIWKGQKCYYFTRFIIAVFFLLVLFLRFYGWRLTLNASLYSGYNQCWVFLDGFACNWIFCCLSTFDGLKRHKFWMCYSAAWLFIEKYSLLEVTERGLSIIKGVDLFESCINSKKSRLFILSLS